MINGLADASHQEIIACDEVRRSTVVSQGNVQQMLSEKRYNPELTRLQSRQCLTRGNCTFIYRITQKK